MRPIEVLVETMAAERNGKARLPCCTLLNGLDAGFRFAMETGLLTGGFVRNEKVWFLQYYSVVDIG